MRRKTSKGDPGPRKPISPLAPDQLAAVERARKRRIATQKPEPLEPHEQQLLDRLDTHDPEITTQVMVNGKMVDENWPHEWRY